MRLYLFRTLLLALAVSILYAGKSFAYVPTLRVYIDSVLVNSYQKGSPGAIEIWFLPPIGKFFSSVTSTGNSVGIIPLYWDTEEEYWYGSVLGSLPTSVDQAIKIRFNWGTSPALYTDVKLYTTVGAPPPVTYTIITENLTGHGTITPSSSVNVAGESVAFTVTPDAGYYISDLYTYSGVVRSSPLIFDRTVPFVWNMTTGGNSVITVQFAQQTIPPASPAISDAQVNSIVGAIDATSILLAGLYAAVCFTVAWKG